MVDVFKQKDLKKISKKPEALERRKFKPIEVDSEEAQLKKLTIEDLEDVISIMRKAMFKIGKIEIKEIKEVLDINMSYGAYVEGFLVGVGLAWPIYFDEVNKVLGDNKPNAIFLSDVALLLSYEGKGIREKLINIREKEGKIRELKYAVTLFDENPKEDNISRVIKERGTREEKAFLNLGYKFVKSKNGLLAFKLLF